MELKQMLAFWKIKDVLAREHHVTQERIDSGGTHFVNSATILAGDVFAIMLYRYEAKDGDKTELEFVYADIMRSGFPRYNSPGSEVLIKNATLDDLYEHFIEGLSPFYRSP